MSVIRKVPFIKYLIDDLTAQQKTTLLDVINGEKSLVNASFDNMPNDAITPVLFKLNERDSKTGILILSSNYRVLIAYHRFQDLLMIKLNSDNTYEKVNEYLDINELRRLVEEANDHIVPSEIDSTGADKGQVITADGNGKTEWTDKIEYLILVGDGGGTLSDNDIALAKQNNTVARYGDGGEMYYKNSQNNYYIVFKATARVAGDDTIVEKLTLDLSGKTWSYGYDVVAAGESFTPEYDDALNEGSENAVQNKVVTEALEEKANTVDLENGTLVPAKSLQAQSIQAVRTE